MSENKVDELRFALKAYLKERNAVEVLTKKDDKYLIEVDKLHQLYTESPLYQLYITEFHDDPDVEYFIKSLAVGAINTLNTLKTKTSFVDVGCGNGFTGLLLSQYGDFSITFQDYEGLGLDFIRHYLSKNPQINGSVVPYGEYVPRHTVAVALDVLEHTHNHLASLRWFRSLGDYVAMSYPLMPYAPPYVVMVDEYVDDEALLYVCEKRYQVILAKIVNGRRFLIYK